MKTKAVAFILLFMGCVSLAAGSYNLYCLYDKSSKTEHTTGTVTHLKTEKTYRHRKISYRHTAHIRYETKTHKASVVMQLYNPFVFQGSEISLWYYPDRTDEVIIPSEEGIVWGSVWVLGALCLFSGAVIKNSRI